ncbi:hypothetical protein [Archangium violaceum]|uniref:hypothetical protein n=1 Tax=Archangium violaceum TaxID=83451 RepID=UPI001EEFE6D8|nr:hypothetical protein [Archangium violaceum]
MRESLRASGPSAPPEVSAQSDALEIDALEVQYMQRLVGLIPNSPRRVKRLLNTYRLLKASTTLEEYARFVRGERESGPYLAIIHHAAGVRHGGAGAVVGRGAASAGQ